MSLLKPADHDTSNPSPDSSQCPSTLSDLSFKRDLLRLVLLHEPIRGQASSRNRKRKRRMIHRSPDQVTEELILENVQKWASLGWAPRVPGVRSRVKPRESSVNHVPVAALRTLYSQYCGHESDFPKDQLILDLLHRFFSSDCIDGAQRRLEDSQIADSIRQGDFYCCLCGITLPSEIVDLILQFYVNRSSFDFDLICSIGLLDWNWYVAVLSLWSCVKVSKHNVMSVPKIVLRGCREITLDLAKLRRLETERILLAVDRERLQSLAVVTSTPEDLKRFFRLWANIVGLPTTKKARREVETGERALNLQQFSGLRKFQIDGWQQWSVCRIVDYGSVRSQQKRALAMDAFLALPSIAPRLQRVAGIPHFEMVRGLNELRFLKVTDAEEFSVKGTIDSVGGPLESLSLELYCSGLRADVEAATRACEEWARRHSSTVRTLEIIDHGQPGFARQMIAGFDWSSLKELTLICRNRNASETFWMTPLIRSSLERLKFCSVAGLDLNVVELPNLERLDLVLKDFAGLRSWVPSFLTKTIRVDTLNLQEVSLMVSWIYVNFTVASSQDTLTARRSDRSLRLFLWFHTQRCLRTNRIQPRIMWEIFRNTLTDSDYIFDTASIEIEDESLTKRYDHFREVRDVIRNNPFPNYSLLPPRPVFQETSARFVFVFQKRTEAEN